MADRLLVAYERDAGYDTHYAHDGVDAETLTPETPTGTADQRDLTRLRTLLADHGIRLAPDRGGPAVDSTPLGTGLSWTEVVTAIDYRAYDGCLRVARDWTTTRFLTCFFGFAARGGTERDPTGDGALLAVSDHEEAFARGWFEGVKSTTADGIRCDLYDERAARSYLAGRVRAFAGDREVYVA